MITILDNARPLLVKLDNYTCMANIILACDRDVGIVYWPVIRRNYNTEQCLYYSLSQLHSLSTRGKIYLKMFKSAHIFINNLLMTESFLKC